MTIAGHEARVVTLGKGAASIVTWFCPEHERAHTVSIRAEESLRTAILRSVRCHEGPVPKDVVDDALYARYDAAHDMKLEDDGDPSYRSWSDGTRTFVVSTSRRSK